MEKKIRYAVVGLGYIAQIAVLPAFKHAKKNSVLQALVSGDRKKLHTLGKKYGVKDLLLYDELENYLKLGKIDAIYIATPNVYHKKFALLAAKYKVHILCEKPLSVREASSRIMVQSAKNHNVKLMTAYRLHFDEANLAAVEAAKSGKLGELKLFSSVFTLNVKDPKNIRLDLSMGGGPLYDIGIYCINAARYLFRSEPIEVFAHSVSSHSRRFREVDETTSAILTFPGNRIASFTVSFGAADISSYDLVGTEGRLHLDQAYDYATDMELQIFRKGKKQSKKFKKHDQFAPELLYFSDCILNNIEPEPSGLEGMADVRIIQALLESQEFRRPLRLDQVHKHKRPTRDQLIHKAGISAPRVYRAVGPEGRGH